VENCIPLHTFYLTLAAPQNNKMNWSWFFAWVVAILLLFFVTGWPVQPALSNIWGNRYASKDLTYYGVLYFHYLLGGLFFSFLGLGLLRNVIWSKPSTKNNRQLAFLLAYSMLIASVVAIVLVHKYSPVEEQQHDDNTDAPQQDNQAELAETSMPSALEIEEEESVL